MLVERLVLRVGTDAAENHGVAVGLGIGDALGTGHATGATDVLDHHGLAEQFAHALRDDAPDRVLRSARGERNDHRYRTRREVFGGSRPGQRQRGNGRSKQYFFHCGPFHQRGGDLRRARLPVKRGRVVWLTDFDDLFGELVQAIARPVTADQVIVA